MYLPAPSSRYCCTDLSSSKGDDLKPKCGIYNLNDPQKPRTYEHLKMTLECLFTICKVKILYDLILYSSVLVYVSGYIHQQDKIPISQRSAFVPSELLMVNIVKLAGSRNIKANIWVCL